MDLDDRLVRVSEWPDGGLPEQVGEGELVWPLDGGALEYLRWYLGEYHRAPSGLWEELVPHPMSGTGPRDLARLAAWLGVLIGPGAASTHDHAMCPSSVDDLPAE